VHVQLPPLLDDVLVLPVDDPVEEEPVLLVEELPVEDEVLPVDELPVEDEVLPVDELPVEDEVLLVEDDVDEVLVPANKITPDFTGSVLAMYEVSCTI
jgi:hypothetical protein